MELFSADFFRSFLLGFAVAAVGWASQILPSLS